MRRTDGPPRILTPEDIRSAQFGTTRMRAGYDMDDVDDFLDRIEASVAALLAELSRLQEAESLLRQQFEQLQARSGGSPYSSTAVQRPASPAAAGPVGSADVGAALAQAAAVRQGLIAQLRSHVAQVNAQIQAVAATLPEVGSSATGPLATAPLATAPLATAPIPSAPVDPGPMATGPITSVGPSAQSPQSPQGSPSARASSGSVQGEASWRGRDAADATGPLPTSAAPTQELPRIGD